MAAILHVGNGGEQNIILPPGQEARHRPMFLDGSDPISQTVYEFHGRLWHRCCNCFPVCKQIAWNLGDRMMVALYQETNEKTATLKEWGYRVVEAWECPWHTQINANFHISDYIQTQQGTRMDLERGQISKEPRAKDYHKINVEQFLGEVQRITKQDQSQPND
ncbi:unnamed protein product [Pocillopora meandrina]|uniref:Uncharacterized protein n=1 Tax=Pocillopora meandrina TaxID=46732 RepID=A0AAU9WZC3_9CNID|nr:unnamed protein product [Pocillopora meandrina]